MLSGGFFYLQKNIVMETPNYYAVIPANVRYAKINANAKLLYGEITALCSKEWYCWANNNYFAKLYDVHKNTIITWLGELRDNWFIDIKINEKNNERKIYLSLKTVYPHPENITPPHPENRVHNNTSNNNTNIIYLEKFVEDWNWINNKWIKTFPSVKKITPLLIKTWRSKINEYSEREIRDAVNNYVDEINSRDKTKSYAQHRFSLLEFLKQSNWLEKFINYWK